MIYVDDPMSIPGSKFDGYCHMWSDGPVDELLAFAARLSLRPDWMQHSSAMGGTPHFDISRRKRAQALENGAQAVKLRDYIKARHSVQEPVDLLFYAYILYAESGEPTGFAVCSQDKYPHGRYVLVGQAPTQERAETLAEELFATDLIEWSLKA